MKADFEKGTKVCSRCKKELPLDMFCKNKSTSDGLNLYCKKCSYEHNKIYRTSDKGKNKEKNYRDRTRNIFGRVGCKRGHSGILKRDYELSEQQLQRRNVNRKRLACTVKRGKYGILIWYSGELEELSIDEYHRAMIREYSRQLYCAIRGYIARVNPSEHFLFDFDLEQMLNDGMTDKNGNLMKRWWKGEIRHWTVKDGIWKE